MPSLEYDGLMSATESDNRRTPRHDHISRVRVLMEAREGDRPTLLHASSRNLSLSGVLVRSESEILIGTRCTVEFLYSAGRVMPVTVPATVRWVSPAPTPSPYYDIGIEFATALKLLVPPREL